MKLNIDTAKKIFAKRYTDKELSKADNIPERIVIRLALSKSPLSKEIENFRQNHSDWEELATFMLSKHGGRRFKRKNAKSSVETFSKKTLDVADTRAREQYANNDQRHQHNKKTVLPKPKEDPSITTVPSAMELPDSVVPTTESEGSNNTSSDWMTSIFSAAQTKDNEEISGQSEDEDVPKLVEIPVKKKAIPKPHATDEGVVVKLDPTIFKKSKNENEELQFQFETKLANEQISNANIGNEDNDFFMAIDDNEVSTVDARNVLTARDIGDDFEQQNKRRARGRPVMGTNGPPQKYPNKYPQFQGNNTRSSSNSSNQPPHVSVPTKEEKLHASWEAMRQQREKQKVVIPTAGASTSKRITFDDDD